MVPPRAKVTSVNKGKVDKYVNKPELVDPRIDNIVKI